ncbi:MAG: hypothetical protein JRJ59_09225, partial [Deltaproteobacteria bacterium]|nr:hypothetical protein [Deltaproteobacteria bacterium]
NSRVETAARVMKEIEQDLKTEKNGLDSTMNQMDKDLERLTKERQTFTAALPPNVVSQYDFIRSRLKEAAVAPVINGTCQLCHMSLTPQEFIELKRLKSLMHCPSCQRIIYWAEYDSQG